MNAPTLKGIEKQIGEKMLVSILMGSLSDREIMRKAAQTLNEYEVSNEISVLSAHRSPNKVREHVLSCYKHGVKVFIVGAGMSAHLAGVVASYTTFPVIGVPLSSKNLDGKDALYSTVQMPPGIPVATVAINGAKNAAILAAQILSIEDTSIMKKLKDYRTLEENKILNISQNDIWN